MPQHYITSTLITDRVQADVDKVLELIDKANSGDTTTIILDSQQLKGAYNYTDLNRVREALTQLSAAMTANSYPHNTLQTMTQYSENAIPYATQLSAYINNLKYIRTILPVMSTTPAAPNDFDNMTYSKANDIEKLLLDIDTMLLGMISAFHHSNSTISGMGGLIV